MNEKDTLIKEWEERVKSIPVATIRDTHRLADYAIANGLTYDDFAILFTVVNLCFQGLWIIDVKPDAKITFGELLDYYERAQLNFIIIHRCNYILHATMVEVYDLLEREKRLRFMVKKNYQKAEDVWAIYERPLFRNMTQEAWSTFHDHMRIAQCILQPRLDKVYESIRDCMIRLGWKDIEVKARIEVAFLVGKVALHSFRAFFKEFEDASGADFSKCFVGSDLQQMVKCFAMMAESLGCKTETDKFGLPDIMGFDCDANIRVKWAWNDFIKDLRDNDLMDESALRAIELNPKTKEDYERLLEEDAQKQLDEGIEKLSEKFNVSKSK